MLRQQPSANPPASHVPRRRRFLFYSFVYSTKSGWVSGMTLGLFTDNFFRLRLSELLPPNLLVLHEVSDRARPSHWQTPRGHSCGKGYVLCRYLLRRLLSQAGARERRHGAGRTTASR